MAWHLTGVIIRNQIGVHNVTRNIHDSGVKHKENVERFLREQNQRSKDKDAETARMNKQMEAIERAAMKQYQLDVEAGLVNPSASVPVPTPHKDSSTTVTVSTEMKTESSVKESSKVDDKKEATGSNSVPVAAAETTLSPRRTKDETVGQPGEWQTVEVPTPTPRVPEKRGQGNRDDSRKDEGGNHYVPGADDEDGEADPEDLRGFKVVEKTYPVDDDLGANEGEESTGGAVFKKRKGGASKPRNIRRKL
ncbi:hypothetical protein BGX28_006859 [Mortierella sp. GBA30]|nr:hypothetical protein BGX28_006859 [Mortierella sp. GBA30]